MNYNWKNVLKFEGSIDPKTIEKAKKAVDLEEKIEWHLNNIKNLDPRCRTYKIGAKLIEEYARDYKSLTGEWYKRDWK